MKKLASRLVPISLLIALIAALVPLPVSAAPTVTRVIPNTIVNDVDNIITVSGSGFDDSAVVLLQGAAVATNFLNDQTLTAAVPKG